MKRRNAGILATIGFGALLYEGHNQWTMFKGTRIWARQRLLIGRIYRNKPRRLEFRARQLKEGIATSKTKSDREKCVFETNFNALLRTRGNQEEAERKIRNQTLVPYSHCDDSSRFTHAATKGFTLAAAGAFLIGLVSFIASTFRIRKERKQEKNL
jgi:hypothetical protein